MVKRQQKKGKKPVGRSAGTLPLVPSAPMREPVADWTIRPASETVDDDDEPIEPCERQTTPFQLAMRAALVARDAVVSAAKTINPDDLDAINGTHLNDAVLALEEAEREVERLRALLPRAHFKAATTHEGGNLQVQRVQKAIRVDLGSKEWTAFSWEWMDLETARWLHEQLGLALEVSD